jgi:integrase
VTRRWHATNAPRWKPHHAAEVLGGLETEILTTLGDRPIKDVTAPAVLEVLRRIESRGAIDTAHRIRGRLSDVFAFGIGEALCETNPAEAIKAAMSPMPKGGHRPAATTLEDARDVLRAAEAIPAYPVTRLAMRFLALTACRPGEVGGMLWSELDGDLWRIPPERMKGGRREHVVPLARQAMDVLATVRVLSGKMANVFPSAVSSRKGMSDNALGLLLRRAGLAGVQVPHGWRATFSTVMNERAPADRLMIDLMLAHAAEGAKGAVEAAYNRAQHMTRRREIAQEWADLLLDGLPSSADLLHLPRKSSALNKM